MKPTLTLLTALVPVFAPLEARNLVPAFPAEPPYYQNRDVFIRSGRTAGYGTPMVAVSSKGTAYLVVNDRLDSAADNGFEQRVALCRSLDQGKTWQDVAILAERPNCTVFPSGLVCDQVANKVFVFFGVRPTQPIKKAYTSVYVIESSDEGATWSEWRDVTSELRPKPDGPSYGTQSGGNALQIQKGKHQRRLVVSSRFALGRTDAMDFSNSVNCVFYSDDHGKTWKPGGHTRGWVGESVLVELSDGSLHLNNRNHDPQSAGVRSHDISHDGGETFTEYGLDRELIEPMCQAGLVRYDAKTILFCNPKMGLRKEGPGFRQNLTVRASFDDCRTWTIEKLIDPGWAGYSSIAVCPDGTILCAYERGTGHPAEIIPSASRQNVAVARFNMAWLLQLDRPAEVRGR